MFERILKINLELLAYRSYSEKDFRITNEQAERLVDFISMKPWRIFLNELWDEKII